jgi:hypothetical protein
MIRKIPRNLSVNNPNDAKVSIANCMQIFEVLGSRQGLITPQGREKFLRSKIGAAEYSVELCFVVFVKTVYRFLLGFGSVEECEEGEKRVEASMGHDAFIAYVSLDSRLSVIR